jgi:HEAT repeat protein
MKRTQCDSNTPFLAKVGLGRHRGSEVVKRLTERVSDDDEDVGRAAVAALGVIRDADAIEALIACLQDEDDQLAEAAAYELQNINTRAARIALNARKQRPEHER